MLTPKYPAEYNKFRTEDTAGFSDQKDKEYVVQKSCSTLSGLLFREKRVELLK